MHKTLVTLVLAALAGCGDCSDGGGASDAGLDARFADDFGQTQEPDAGVDASAMDLGRLNDAGDCSPIEIEHMSPGSVPIGAELPLSARASASAGTLLWRRGGEVDYQTMPLAEEQGTWTATIPAPALTFAGIDYYLQLSSGRCVATSGTPDAPHHVAVYGEFRVTQAAGGYEYTPDVWERLVVYAEEASGGASDDIVLFDLDTLRARNLTSDGRAQGTPRIWGHNIAFVDNYGTNPEIALFDMQTETHHRVTNNDAGQYGLEIDRHIIAWRDDRNMTGPYNGDIYAYDLGPDMTFGTADDRGELQLAGTARDETAPKVHVSDDGRVRVVYASMWDDADGLCDANCDWNVYLVDFGEDGIWGTNDDIGPVAVTSEPSEQTSPVIWGTRIAWLDARGGNWLDPDIWWMDLGPDGQPGTADDTPAQLLDTPVNDPDNLAIWQDRLVWEDYRTMGYELYQWDFASGVETQLTNVAGGQFYAEIWDDVIVWQDARNNAGGEFFDDVYVWVAP